MCGIGGILALNGPLSERDLSALQRMSDSIAHRGPVEGHPEVLWRVLSLELWHRRVIRGRSLRPEGASGTPHGAPVPGDRSA